MKSVIMILTLEVTRDEDGTIDWRVVEAAPPEGDMPAIIEPPPGFIYEDYWTPEALSSASSVHTSLGTAIEELSVARRVAADDGVSAKLSGAGINISSFQAELDRALADLILTRQLGTYLSGSGGNISSLRSHLDQILSDLEPARGRLRDIPVGAKLSGSGGNISSLVRHFDRTIESLETLRGFRLDTRDRE